MTSILMVEDNETDFELQLAELRRNGLTCEARRVDTEPSLVQALVQYVPDVILCDFSMPRFGGLRALEVARLHAPQTPFVFVSGGIGEDLAVESLKHGATDYVLKSNLKRLAPAVRRALEEAQLRVARSTAEHALSDSEQRYRDLFHSNPHPMWLFDTQTSRFLEVNDVAVARYGFTREEFLAMTVDDIRSEHAIARLLQVAPTPPRAGPQSAEHKTKNGKLIEVELACHDLMFGSKLLRTVVAYDITERKKAERRFTSLLESARDAMIILNQTGRIVLVNSQTEKLFGYAYGELLGQQIEMLLPKRCRSEHLAHRKRLFEGGSAHPVGADLELCALRKDGTEFAAQISLSPLQTEDGVLAASAIRDITEHKQQQEKLARLTRIHAVRSGINSAIVRIRGRKELYQEACRIAVQAGGFLMTWIGTVSDDARVEPVAWEGGSGGYIEKIRSMLNEPGIERFPLVRMALTERKAMVAEDMKTDARIALRKEALMLGLCSMVILPLVVEAEAIGVLTLYAGEAGFFDEEEMKLLLELAGDLSFAMEHIQQGERLSYLAYYDELTGLANRALAQDRLRQALQFAERYRSQVAVLMIGLDRFKLVNETLGHAAGDELLKLVAGRLVACVRDIDTIARLGGDGFIAVLAGADQNDNATSHVVQRILEAFAQPLVVMGRELFVSCSIGAALFPRDGEDIDPLLRNADAAMHRAKEQGRNNCQFYTPEVSARAQEHLSVESALRRALEREQLRLHYQPQVDLRTGTVIGLEALVRWERPDHGMMAPARFIRIAEETGLILSIGEWVLHTASLQNKAWQDQTLPKMRIAVNLSPQQFRQKDFARRIREILSHTGLEPEYLEVELTESTLMADVESTVRTLSELREAGVQISLDDFGTGYSSLSYLKRFPIDTLKIDQSFVQEITSDADSKAIADAIIAMAHSLHLSALAEGVETEGQLALLRARGCDQLQGNLFSKPLPPEALAQFLRDRHTLPASSPATRTSRRSGAARSDS